jgi:hypothetical protein
MDQLLKNIIFFNRYKFSALIRKDPRIFYDFIYWLFGRRIEKFFLDLTELVRAWILGQKYRTRNFQNSATQARSDSILSNSAWWSICIGIWMMRRELAFT